jgi:hypothetical protein
MEAKCSSETSVDFQRTTWPYIPEDRTLQLAYRYSTNIGQEIYTSAKPCGRIILKMIQGKKIYEDVDRI